VCRSIHLHALRELAGHFRQYDLSNTVVVSPDLGRAKDAAEFARLTGCRRRIGAKQRYADDRVVISAIIARSRIGTSSYWTTRYRRASTISRLLDRLREQGVRSVRIACTHGIFANSALERIEEQPDVAEIVSTNTVPIPMNKRVPKLCVLSVAPVFAEAIRRIHNGESVSTLL